MKHVVETAVENGMNSMETKREKATMNTCKSVET